MSLILSLLLFLSGYGHAESGRLPIAVLDTSFGKIRIKLYENKTPKTVENFVALATGTKRFIDATTGKHVDNTPFYKNMIFHKVFPKYFVQTGCPWKDGRGWPGFYIEDEIRNDLKFNREGLVAMAKKDEGRENSTSTAGSQFFITLAPLPYLDGKFTIFGEVISGMEIVRQISEVPTNSLMLPETPVALKSISIE